MRKHVPYLIHRAHTNQPVQNKPFVKYFSQPNIVFTESVIPEPEPQRPKYNYSKRFSLVGVIDHVPLSRLPVNLERPLWRRPTSFAPEPVKEDGLMFNGFKKRLELKPKNFATSTEQDIFYNKNYPLLLDAHPEEDIKVQVRKRTPTPEVEWTPEMKRGMSISSRITNLDNLVDQFEEETEDEDPKFKTELRHEVFSPALWPWNKGSPSYCAPTPRTLSMASSRPKSPTSAGPTLPRRLSMSMSTGSDNFKL